MERLTVDFAKVKGKIWHAFMLVGVALVICLSIMLKSQYSTSTEEAVQNQDEQSVPLEGTENEPIANLTKIMEMEYDEHINIMCVDGRYIYTGGYGGNVRKIDIGDESAPEIVESVVTVKK